MLAHEILTKKLKELSPRDRIEQDCALKEIFHYFILASLSRYGFFKTAEFHGGTFLRIVHQLPRFSEDLDFVSKTVNPSFGWEEFIKNLKNDLGNYGIEIDFLDKSEKDSNVRKAFLKTESLGRILKNDLPFSIHSGQKIRVKVEIDTNPPSGSKFENQFISYPELFAVTSQTLPSAFASKSHALLCREYTKGRDWYDFIWYVGKGVSVNYQLLENALMQVGPWKSQQLKVTKEWYIKELKNRITSIDWKKAKEDVENFLRKEERGFLNNWDEGFFITVINRLNSMVG